MKRKLSAAAGEGVVVIPAGVGVQMLDEADRMRQRLEEAEEVLRAIRSGDVDAVVVEGPRGEQLFTLKGADAPYRILIEEMNQGAVTLSADGAILYCNRRFAALARRPIEEIIGCSFDMLVAPDDRAGFLSMLKMESTGGSMGEITLEAIDGGPIPVQLALSRLPADAPAAICLIATDISESKRAAAELKTREARLSEAQGLAHLGSWEWDIATDKVTWSDELYRIYDLDRATHIPTRESYSERIHPEDRPWVMERVEKALRENGSFNHDHRILRADGTAGMVHSRGNMVINSNGNPLKFVGTSQDITERKRVETALEEANRRLRDLSRQAGMAEVATNVLHNVGNVLNSVNVSATLIADGVNKSQIGDLDRVVALLAGHAADLGTFVTSDPRGKTLTAFLRQISEHITRERQSALVELKNLCGNIEHIKEIVAMQQTYAKVSGMTEVLHVADLVEDSLRMNAGSLIRHEVHVIRDYQEVPPISIEKHKVLQILVNLIRNAKHACDDAGISEKQMTLRVVNGGDTVRISVIDNGIGVPRENLDRIFNHGFTTRKNGHGFGLHSGANAARELGGSLTATSNGPGEGASFTLELPCQPGGIRS